MTRYEQAIQKDSGFYLKGVYDSASLRKMEKEKGVYASFFTWDVNMDVYYDKFLKTHPNYEGELPVKEDALKGLHSFPFTVMEYVKISYLVSQGISLEIAYELFKPYFEWGDSARLKTLEKLFKAKENYKLSTFENTNLESDNKIANELKPFILLSKGK